MIAAARYVIAFAGLLLGQSLLAAEVSLTADRTSARLSDRIRLVLTVTGKGPIRVELPTNLLDPSAVVNWRLIPAGPATVEDTTGGLQRWSQAYWADPYRPGDPLRIAFLPVRISESGNAPVEVAVPRGEIRVITELVSPKSADIRPVTGIDFPASRPVTSQQDSSPWLAAGFVVCGVCGIFLFFKVRSRWPIPTRPAIDIVREMLEKTSDDVACGAAPAIVAERTAAAVRWYIGRRFGLPCATLTPSELKHSLGMSAGQDIQTLLDACEAFRFGGDELPVKQSAHLIMTAKLLVERLSQADRTATQ